MWWVIGIVLAFSLGVVIGLRVSTAIKKSRGSGTLHVIQSDPDGPNLFLELDDDLQEVAKREYIILRVTNTVYYGDSSK